MTLRVGEGMRSCVGLCHPDHCDSHYLELQNDGTLALHRGEDGSGASAWRAAPKRWFRKPAVADDYWATISGRNLQIGRDDKVLLSKSLAKCGPLRDVII